MSFIAKQIQAKLNEKGFGPLTVDGVVGPKTLAAVSAALDKIGKPVSEKPIQTSDAEPRWLVIARSYIGTKEVKGSKHNSTILKWWAAIKASFRDDETPWCAGFVGGVLEEAGIKSSRSAAARSYEKYGVKLDKPAVGCIVVFWRGSPNGWSGHVGFVVGRDKYHNLMVLGGNQSDAVNIKPFGKDRVLAYRWPGIWPLKERFNLPLLTSDGNVSTNEA